MLYLMVIVLILGDAGTQAVRVIGGNVTVVQGDTAFFPCTLTDTTESLTQISWQRRTRALNQNTNFFTILFNNGPQFVNGHDKRFSFIGSIAEKNGSLQLSNVTLSDEGTYTCIYTLFPSGNYKTEIPLNVQVPPLIKVAGRLLTVGDVEVALASCTASNSWPAAKVHWELGTLSHVMLRISDNSTENADGTTTTVSTLFGIPVRDLHNQSVQCLVTSPALPKEATLPFTIQIHFSPSEVNITETSKNSFECMSEANPKANFSWSRPGQPWPESAVRIEGALLEILRPTPELNGIFQCKASNTYGTQQGHIYLYLSNNGTGTVGWVLFSLILFLNVAAGMWFYNKSKKKCVLPCLSTNESRARRRGTVPPQDTRQMTQDPVPATRQELETLHVEVHDSD